MTASLRHEALPATGFGARLGKLGAAALTALLLVGCAGPNGNETAGTLIGAGVGALIGNQFGSGSGRVAATAVGAMAGGLIGNRIGADIDRADQRAWAEAQQRAYYAQLNTPIQWRNPNTGNYGTVTPVQERWTPYGQYCREYQTTVTIDGQTQQAYGTACQQPDGSWQVVN